MPYKGNLVGVRQPANEADGCAVCGNLGAPALAYLPNPNSRGANRPLTRYCLPCVGRAVEDATGWRVLRAWSQWLASSLQAQEYRVNKSKENTHG
ncbi:hypothetical protein EB001_27560 [bacterium]|nr:hypothetical protein [bacterium]